MAIKQYSVAQHAAVPGHASLAGSTLNLSPNYKPDTMNPDKEAIYDLIFIVLITIYLTLVLI